ncbi:MAG: hypothetical protein AB8H12_10715 [Lewinella sp.]
MKLIKPLALLCLLLTYNTLFSAPQEGLRSDCITLKQQAKTLSEKNFHLKQDLGEVHTINQELSKDNRRAYALVKSLKEQLGSPDACRNSMDKLVRENATLKQTIDQLKLLLDLANRRPQGQKATIGGSSSAKADDRAPGVKSFDRSPNFIKVKPETVITGQPTLQSGVLALSVFICLLAASFFLGVLYLGLKEKWRTRRWLR